MNNPKAPAPQPPADATPKCEGWQHMAPEERAACDPQTFCDAYEASECASPCPAGQCAERPGPGDLTPQGEADPPVSGEGDEKAVREIALRYGTEQTGCLSRLCEARRGSIVAKATREAYAAGLARGRALGARDVVDYFATPDATEEAAKGLVENPSWNYDGAREEEKEYYRRFARKCVARLAAAIARRAGRGT